MRIHIRNTYCLCTWNGVSPLFVRAVQWLTVRAKNYQYSTAFKNGLWDGTHKFLSEKTRSFPTGLLPILLTKAAEEHGEPIELIDERQAPPVLEGRTRTFPLSLRPYQVDAYRNVITNTLQHDSTALWWPRGIIKVATGGGKTAIMAKILHAFGPTPRAVILLQRKDLLKQTTTVLEELLGEQIGFVGDGAWAPQRITVGMVPTLFTHADAPSTKELLQSAHILCGDEAHHMGSADTFWKVSMRCPASVRVAFSATPYKQDDLVQAFRLQGTTGHMLYEQKPGDLIDEGFLPHVNVIYHRVDAPNDQRRLPYSEAVRVCIVDNTARNAHIIRLAKAGIAAGHRIMVHVVRLDHGALLAKAIGIPFLSGKESTAVRMGAADALRRGAISGVVVTTIWQEGVDIPDVDMVILAAGGKSEIDTLQRIGRGMRLKEGGKGLEVHDFLDMTHRNLLQHSRQRFLTCKRAGFTVAPLESVG